VVLLLLGFLLLLVLMLLLAVVLLLVLVLPLVVVLVVVVLLLLVLGLLLVAVVLLMLSVLRWSLCGDFLVVPSPGHLHKQKRLVPLRTAKHAKQHSPPFRNTYAYNITFYRFRLQQKSLGQVSSSDGQDHSY